MKSYHLKRKLILWKALIILLVVVHLTSGDSIKPKRPLTTTFNDVALNSQTMTAGINLNTFDITRAKPHGKQMKSIMLLTHHSGTELPDQMEPIVPEGRFQADERMAHIKTASEMYSYFVQETKSLDIWLEDETLTKLVPFLADSFSRQMEQVTKFNHYMAMLYTCQSEYQLKFNKSALSLNPRLIKLSSDPANYDRIIQQYGTHYISTGIFGGCLLSTASIDGHLAEEVANIDDTALLNAAMQLVRAGKVYRVESVDARVKDKVVSLGRMAQRECLVVGGKIAQSRSFHNCYSSKGKNNWLTSVASTPRLIYAELTPIYELEIFAKNRDVMKRKVEQTMVKTVLVRLKRLLTKYQYRLVALRPFSGDYNDRAINDLLNFMDNECSYEQLEYNFEACLLKASKAIALMQVMEIQPYFMKLMANGRKKLNCAYDEVIVITKGLLAGKDFHGNIELQLYIKQLLINTCPVKPNADVVETIVSWPDVKGSLKQLVEDMRAFIDNYNDGSFSWKITEIRTILDNLQRTEKIAYTCDPKQYALNLWACRRANQEAVLKKVKSCCEQYLYGCNG